MESNQARHMAPRIDGHSVSSERFFVQDLHQPFDPRALASVLEGERAVCRLHGLFDAQTCQQLRRNFWHNRGLRRRGDQVPGHYVGAYHYAKSTEEYLDDCDHTRTDVDALFEGVTSPLETLQQLLARAASASGRTVRRAEHGGRRAGLCGATSWSAPGQYMLAPHDDVAQVGTRAQRGFEIEQVRQHTVVGINLYVSMPKQGGELEMWNVCPGEDCRRALGLVDRGHPYSVQSLAPFESQVIAVESGDCVVLNGAFVHGVRGAMTSVDQAERRLILTLFVGIKDDKTVLWWT